MAKTKEIYAQDWLEEEENGGLPRLGAEERALAAQLILLASEASLDGGFRSRLEDELAGQAAKIEGPAPSASGWSGLRKAGRWTWGAASAILLVIALIVAMQLRPGAGEMPAGGAGTSEPNAPEAVPVGLSQPVEGFLTPPETIACQELRTALQATLKVKVELVERAAYIDPSLMEIDANGQGCELRAHGSGTQFGGLQAGLEKLRPLLEDRGYQYNGEFSGENSGIETPYFPDGWYGKIWIFNRSDKKAQLSLS